MTEFRHMTRDERLFLSAQTFTRNKPLIAEKNLKSIANPEVFQDFNKVQKEISNAADDVRLTEAQDFLRREDVYAAEQSFDGILDPARIKKEYNEAGKDLGLAFFKLGISLFDEGSPLDAHDAVGRASKYLKDEHLPPNFRAVAEIITEAASTLKALQERLNGVLYASLPGAHPDTSPHASFPMTPRNPSAPQSHRISLTSPDGPRV